MLPLCIFMGQPFCKCSEIIDNSLANLGEGVRGFWQTSEKFVMGSQRYWQRSENLLAGIVN
jgi:hypothetical protein